jgi:hypothetical protein
MYLKGEEEVKRIGVKGIMPTNYDTEPRLQWCENPKTPRNPRLWAIAYAEIARYFWLHGNQDSGAWFITKSADSSSRAEDNAIVRGQADLTQPGVAPLVAIERSAREAVRELADTIASDPPESSGGTTRNPQ